MRTPARPLSLLVPEPPYSGEDLLEGDLLGEHLGRTRFEEPLVDVPLLHVGHHQNRHGGVGSMQVADHILRAWVGEGYVHHGGVYAALGHLLAPFGHRTALGHHLEVRLLVYEVGGGLAEGGVVLHEQDECHLLLAPFFRLSLFSVAYVPTRHPELTYGGVNASELRRTP